ncbi:hypothetical protein GM661_12195 [Iocasia frigidifontis]|uniref:Uncharacterized protein n=1 Tax=Iocasia fonsfrigidae TaxID=2682810 RepID=A0A8A7KGN9_9FIRM|nr:contractile injection system protein, VgrG/Pvc8 family [Iocasia fonsfrigidae]QTL98669.1 hypothetical protein GM661_12195 [Iocasia fonsfrigidae]
MSEKKITHKELLTFSNLTNLDWHFVDIEPKQETDQNGKVSFVYHKLNSLLTPNSFIKAYKNPRTKRDPIYCYGTDNQGTYLGKDEGLAEMRQNAGIAMEYLEKWQDEGNKEGKFLGEWEVVYGADSYKVVTDYLDYIYRQSIKGKTGQETTLSHEEIMREMEVPSREGVEETEEHIENIEFGVNCAEKLLSLVIWKKKLDSSGKIKKVTKEILKGVSRNELKELAKKIEIPSIKLFMLAYLNRNSGLYITKDLSKEIAEDYQESLEEKTRVEGYEDILEENIKVKITQSLKMHDTGFRVLVLKKGDDIVISYKGKKTPQSKILPEDLDYLQIVYDKIKREHNKQNTKISFTGFEGGADLGFINSLFADEKDECRAGLFYNKIDVLKGFIDFTPEDIDKEYIGNISIIVVSEAKGITNQMAENAFYSLLLLGAAKSVAVTAVTSTLLVAGVIIILIGILNVVKKVLKDICTEKTYKRLQELGFVATDKSAEKLLGDDLVKGYITDEFYEHNNYVEFPIRQYPDSKGNIKCQLLLSEPVEFTSPTPLANNKHTIKIKKEDAVYLLLNMGKNEILKEDYSFTLQNQEVKFEYLFYRRSAAKREMVHNAILGPQEETVGYVHQYWGLAKNKSGYYEIKGTFKKDPNPPQEQVFGDVPYNVLLKEEEEEITKYNMLVNLMEITGTIQRNYIKKKDDIFEFIYPEDNKPVVVQEIPTISQNNEEYEYNEFFFMPYLDEDGIISQELRSEYIASVFKSAVLYYYLKKLAPKPRGSNYTFKHRLNKIKYGQEDINKIEYNFGEKTINEKFRMIMYELQYGGGSPRSHGSIKEIPNCQVSPYYYKSILDIFKDEIQEFEKYYQVKNIKEVERRYAVFFVKEDIDGLIMIDPTSALEYKYNPDDYILGGELKIKALNISDKEREKKEAQKKEFRKLAPQESLSSLSMLIMLKEGEKENLKNSLSEEQKEEIKYLIASRNKGYEESEESLAVEEVDTSWDETDRERYYLNNYRNPQQSIEEKALKFNQYLFAKDFKQNQAYIARNIFGIDLSKENTAILKEIGKKIRTEKKFKADIYQDEEKKSLVINYDSSGLDYKLVNLCAAIGIPNEEFDRAEKVYRQEVEENGEEYQYTLKAYSAGGALAQYAGLMSEGYLPNYQVINYNPLGIGKMLKFNGNEFLGYKIGLDYYLSKILQGNNSMNILLYELIDRGVIKYGNISSEYRNQYAQTINSLKMKRLLYSVYQDKFNLSEKQAKEIIDKNFNPLIIERKMRLIDRYQAYESRVRGGEGNYDNIINYIISDDIIANLFEKAGASYIVDKDLKGFEKGKNPTLINRIKKLKEEELEKELKTRLDQFVPFLLLKENANGGSAVNRLRRKPAVGNMTNKLSQDYLQALIKDIVLDLNKKDKNVLKELFKRSRRGHSDYFLEIIKDRLRHSMKSQKKLAEDERVFKSRYLQEKPELLTEKDKVYPLAQAALEQMEEMNNAELQDLYNWEIRGDGIELILCPQKEEEEVKVIEYYSSDSALKFDNQEKRLKLECQDPSKNRIYGSNRQGNYFPEKDIEYLVSEDEVYEFNNTQGLGFTIFSPYTSPEKIIKIDGITIDRQYEEIDRDEANIGKRTKTLRDSYFGDNIILRDKKSIYGEPCGELIYFYGPEKKDELIIEGFQNGDYGIKLREKIRSKEEKAAALTYTEHQLKIEPFEFAILNKFKISREIYQHSVLEVQGVIKKENRHKYYQYLREQEDPTITITYDNDDRKILFKGIIEEFGLGTRENQTHYLRIKAFSYSKLLARRRRNRVFQNIGTSYQGVFDKIKSQNLEFHIDFADTSVASTPLINEDYPVVIQYKESEWDFIKRLATYVNQILIVDDTKDNQEIINIQAGPHNNVAQELNNIAGGEGRKTGRKNTKYKYYRIKEHEHYRSDDIFQIGKKVNYRISNKTKETLELIIIKNVIYLKNQRLCSDLIMVKEEDIKLVKEIREKRIEGRSFRGEVVKVNNKYQAKVRFIDLADDFQEDKAHWFPIDRIYTTAFIAPEIGDIVDIYFKARNEKYASVGKTTRVEKREINHDPADKMIKTPGDYQIRLNNQSVLFAAPKMSSKVELKEKEINLESNGSSIKMKENIKLKADKAFMLIDKDVLQFGFGGNGIKVKDGEINIS